MNKTSQEKLIVLLNEFTGGGEDDGSGNGSQVQSMPDQLPAQGEGENVPFHLRSSVSVKNRRLTRRDVAVLIQEVWNERRLSDQQVRSRIEQQFDKIRVCCVFRTDERRLCLNSFTNSSEIDTEIITSPSKWVTISILRANASNITTIVNCSLKFYPEPFESLRFSWKPTDSFLFVQADENVYHHTKSLIEQLAERLIKDAAGTDGNVTNDQLTEILTRNFPDKAGSEIAELVAAAGKEQANEEKIAVAKLFSVVKKNETHR